MRKTLVAAAIIAVGMCTGLIGWHAVAAPPVAAIPHAGPYTPIHPAACGGRDEHCPHGSHWVCGPEGKRCWCTPC